MRVAFLLFAQNARQTLANWRQKCQKWKVITLLNKTFISSYTILDNSNGVLFLASLLHFMVIFFSLKQQKSFFLKFAVVEMTSQRKEQTLPIALSVSASNNWSGLNFFFV